MIHVRFASICLSQVLTSVILLLHYHIFFLHYLDMSLLRQTTLSFLLSWPWLTWLAASGSTRAEPWPTNYEKLTPSTSPCLLSVTSYLHSPQSPHLYLTGKPPLHLSYVKHLRGIFVLSSQADTDTSDFLLLCAQSLPLLATISLSGKMPLHLL